MTLIPLHEETLVEMHVKYFGIGEPNGELLTNSSQGLISV